MEVSCPQADPIDRIKIDLTTNPYSGFLPINVFKKLCTCPHIPSQVPQKEQGASIETQFNFLENRLITLRIYLAVTGSEKGCQKDEKPESQGVDLV